MLFLIGIEIVLAMLAVMSFRDRATELAHPRVTPMLYAAAFLTVSAALVGGVQVAAMAFKVLLFGLCLAYAMWHPAAATRWVVVVVTCSLAIAAANGSLGTKLGALPFLLLATLWASRTTADERTVRSVFALALLGECAQAVALGSRGGLLAVGLAVLLWLLPKSLAKRGLVLSAIALPVVYPLALTAALVSMLLGLDFIESTASNVERSTLSAWCIDKMFDFLLPGPGGTLYAEDTNDLGQLFSGVGDRGIVDPHHFPLSAWVWLGTLPTLALHAAWSATWWQALRQGIASPSRHHLVLGALAILTYTLSPPDSVSRLLVALQSGIALAGLLGTKGHPHPTWSDTTPASPSLEQQT